MNIGMNANDFLIFSQGGSSTITLLICQKAQA